MPQPSPNSDESLVTADHPFIGNFHKTLPHNEYGEVEPDAYRKFERICHAVEAGMPINFEDVPKGKLPTKVPTSPPDAQSVFDQNAEDSLLTVARFTSPLAGAATEAHGPDPKTMEMPPAPGCRSISTAAEMAEVYWMALLRDVPLLAFQDNRTSPEADCVDITAHDSQRVNDAIKWVNTLFDCAVRHDTDPGKLRTPLDVNAGPGGADIKRQTLFRSGLVDEEFGPLVSQFFIRPIGYGTQTIDQKLVPYVAKRDFLTTHGDWLLAQNTGKDRYGRDYGICNNYSDQLHRGASYYPLDANGQPIKRYISTMRDLARFVNRDALHQAYFNAALFLDGLNGSLRPDQSILDAGNPYRGNRYTRENPFASLGGPDLLTLVSEVASRALKAVWRQKWLVHRRARPEVYGGLVQMQRKGYNCVTRDYGLPTTVAACPNFDKAFDATLAAVAAHNATMNGGGEETYFLPMAFSAGSPTHPAYGAGHATVAGACVTTLKAWFDEDAKLAEVFAAANAAASCNKIGPKDPPGGELKLLQPGYRKDDASDLEAFCDPKPYTCADANRMTIGGELNKIASNVAMGRSMGGVHWRTDNTRSLRLGEAIAVEILRKRTLEYAERPVSFTFRAFDGHIVRIADGQVQT